jgi:chromosome segregation ATPase
MCGNRVEELESRVQELEASVEGLTDELVECKLRLRELEKASDEDLGVAAHSGANDTLEAEIEEAVDEEELADADAEEAEDEAPKSEADDAEDETEEPDSDIIVA